MANDGTLRFDTAIDESGFNDGLEGIQNTAKKQLVNIGKAAAGVVAGMKVADIAADAAKAVVSNADEMKKAMNQFAASTGAGAAELSGYRDIMEDIYKNNYGESFEDIGATMAAVKKQLGKMDNKTFQKTVESAITLRDTFEYEVSDSIRATKALMDNFDISAEKGMNLIANGAQNGLDFSGELIDSINEYSVQFAKVGLSADDMFSIFQAGADSGAWNLDKIGDAVKEFSIRAIDGSNTTIDGFKKLGMNADEMAQKFAAGGDDAREAFKQVIKGLADMEDPVEQSIAGVDLFGTMWEDLGPEVVEQLANIEDTAYGSQDALEKIKEVRYEDVGSSLATLGKTVMEKFIGPIADTALPAVKGAIDGITEAIDRPKTMLEEFVDEVNASNKVVKASIGQAKSTMSDAVAEAAKIEAYKGTLLELNDITGKTEYQRYQMNAIVSELSESIPQLTAAYDEETASINLSKEAIAALMDNEKEYLMQQAAMKAKAEAMEALMQAELNVAKAESAVEDAENSLKEAMGKRQKASEDMYGDYGDYNAEIAEWEHQVKSANKALEESKDLEGEAQEEYALTSKSMEEATKKVNEYTDELARMNLEEQETATGVSEANEDMAESGQQMSAEQAAAAQAVQEAYQEMKGSIQDSIENSIDLFDKFSGGTEISKDKVLENLKSQSAGVKEWGENMKALAARAGEGMTKELYDYLAAMGPQSANLVKAFTQMSKDELAKAAQEFASLDGGLSESVSQQVVAASAAWGEAAAELSQAAGEAGAKSTEEFTKAAESELKDGSGKVVDTASKSGTDTGKAMQKSTADAVRQGAGAVSSAVNSSMQGAENTALGYYDNFYTVGQNLMKGAAAGIAAGAPAVEKAARDAMQRTVDGSKKQIDSHSPSRVMRDEVGKMISAGAAEGIRNGIGDVEQGARDMAGASLDAAKDELDIHSPSGVFRKEVGAQIVKGIIQGIENEERKLTRKMEALSESALKIAKKANGDYSQAGSRMAELIGGSLQKRQDLATRKAEALVDKYIEKVSNTGTVARYERLAEKKEEEARKYSRKDGKGNQEKAKQLERQAKQLKKKAEKYKKQFAKFGSSLMDSLNGGIEAEFGKIREGLSERLTEISDECQRLYDDVKGRQAGMFSEMSSPVNFYDLDTQLEEVQRYQDGLNRLKGRIPDTLMEEITGMGLKDAVSFSEYLNSLTDAELEAYKGKWERLQGQAKSYSGSFFEKELAAIRAEYEKKVGEAMADAETRMKEVGKNICKGLVKGLNSEKELLSKECRKMAKGMVKEFKAAFGIHSPSKVMERQVGKYLPQGLAEGVEGALPDAERRITAGVERAIASLQGRVEALQSIPAVPYGSVSVYPQVTVMNSQPVQVQAEIRTTVDLDGRTVGRAVTPYVNERLGIQQVREERGS